MTVLGFGRENKNKFLTTAQSFTIGLVESTDYSKFDQTTNTVLE